MSMYADLMLSRLLSGFDELIARSKLCNLPEVATRLEELRDVIQRGVDLRKLVEQEERNARNRTTPDAKQGSDAG